MLLYTQETNDIMDLYHVQAGRVVGVNSWEFIDHVNDVFEKGGFKELWHTLRFIVGEGTECSARYAVLADGGEFYPAPKGGGLIYKEEE